MSMFMDDLEAAPPPPPVPSSKSYTFKIHCVSGQWKEFKFFAENFVEARRILNDIKESN